MNQDFTAIEVTRDDSGARIVAYPRVFHHQPARVLAVSIPPAKIDEFDFAQSYAPFDMTVGFGPFNWAWPVLKHMTNDAHPVYRVRRCWATTDPGVFGRRFAERAAGGWFMLRSQMSNCHLVCPDHCVHNMEATGWPLPREQILLEGWSVDVALVTPDGLHSWSSRSHKMPSKHCPWFIPMPWLTGEPWELFDA